ncbi:hypothetical protein [Pseudarthrobacter sp. AB1]|uniref:hypothetical protein n=1 Tax=Pseudarthrobacter sp. AB1 TaxID=2138309 RepID=UPI00186B8F86|nr:hypothetical protein [Pseudarthrobacter sp. AB1]MBE4718828.1 hypothetical protein [Pseudarthrobacter sp. AB1]
MNQQRFGQKFGRATGAQAGTTPEEGSAKGAQKPASAKPGTTNQAVLGPFTLRDLAVFAATLILLVASLLPIFFGRFNLWNAGSLFFLGLGIVLPLIVSALFVGRRLAPATRVRIGSLSVDQFASVVASFALAFFFVSAAAAYVPSLLVGLVGSVVLFAGTVLSRYIPYFAGDFLGRDESPAHVMARESAVPLPKPHTPKEPKPEASPVPAAFAASATPAASAGAFSSPAAAAAVSSAPEVNEWTAAGDPGPATHAADVVPSPTATNASVTPAVEETTAGDTPTAAAAPVESAPTATAASASAAPEAAVHDAGAGVPAPARQSAAEPAATAVHQQVRSVEPIGATVDPASRPEESDEEPAHEAFWFAVAQHRTAVDPQTGAPAFVIEPGGWVLALEDRGHEFLVQHTDGRVGVLRDLSNIERG